MVASSSIPLRKESQEAFTEYYRSMQSSLNTLRSQRRSRFEAIDRTYQREVDLTEEHLRAKAANAAGDTSRLQNITVPVVMPQVEAAVTYQASVFLTGHPIFGVVSGPQYADEAVQMASILEDESTRGGWARHLMLFFRDGFKYNFSALEVDWAQEVTYAVQTDLLSDSKQGVPKEVIWSGNRITRLDPYNTFVDPRVLPTEVYKDGEFAGYTRYMSRIQLKSYIASLPDTIIANIVPAFESGGPGNARGDTGAFNFFVPAVNPAVYDEAYLQQGTNWMSWAGLKDSRTNQIAYKDAYEVTTLYARVLPSEFGLKIPKSNTPQIFKLILVNHQHIIYAELQTNAHNYLPIFIGQPLEDGLGYQTKSLADNGKAFQEVTTTYMNSIIASRRRAISDRVLYDPSRITSAHINSPNPSAKIPVRPAAYGKNIAESVYQFPYKEDQASPTMQQVSSLLAMANQLSGQNNVTQGQFQKGNKTLHEFDTVMQNANGRDQLASILLEYQVFIPIKHVLKTNILQYQGGDEIYNRDTKQVVEIDPIKLRKAVLEFKVSDGLIPSTKLMNADSFSVAMQVIGSSPQVAGSYNIAPLFSYLMKSQGADLSDFEKSQEQVAYEQALQAWQQMMAFAIEKGMDPEQAEQKLPPMPTPEQFGYDPAANKPAAPGSAQMDQGTQEQGV